MQDFTREQLEEVAKLGEPSIGRLVSRGGNLTTEAPQPLVQTDKLTVIQQFVHISKLAGTHATGGNYERTIKTEEEAWRRERFAVGERWKKLDLGWFTMETLGLVVLRHRGEQWDVNPTPEQRQVAEAKVVHILFQRGDEPALTDGEGDLVLYPGESTSLTALHDGIWMRCLSGEAELAVAIYPR